MIVQTKYGKVEGYQEDGMYKFKGIPYAKAPIGNLRFKRSLPIDSWQGILEAKEYKAASVQDNHESFIGSEDCLTINVFTPSKIEKKLPVFIWIHGGGYNIGRAEDPMYQGEAFVEDGIIFVSFQYRLNVLGVYDFSLYPGVKEKGFETNCALSDMILAIQWVHENIEYFGGDINNVTIAGESAGGAAVTTLMAVPKVKGMFQKVIAQSSLVNCVMSHSMQKRICDLFLEGMHWSEEEVAQKLWTCDPFELVKGHNYVERYLQERIPGTLEACPVLDDLLPMYPIDAISNGYAKGIDLIIGTNLHEGSMFIRKEGTTFPNSWELIERMFKENHNEIYLDAIKSYYSNPSFEEKYGNSFVHFATDYAFQIPSTQFALAQSQYANVRMYRYEFINQAGKMSGLKAAHAFELPYVFKLKNPRFYKGEDEKVIQKLWNGFHDTWVSFSKGEPLDWPLYTSVNSPMRIYNQDGYIYESIDKTECMNLWKNLKFFRE